MRVTKEGNTVCVQHPQEPGKPPRWDEYYQVRGGITWPVVTHPGYFCLLGLARNRPTLSGKKPLVFLTEGESNMLGNFFDKLLSAGHRFFCDRFYADLSKNGKGFEDALRRHIQERKAEPPRVWDSSEFDSLEIAISVMNQWVNDSALEIKRGTILNGQLAVLTLDNLKGETNPIYAVEALARVVMSFEEHPFRRGSRQGSRFANWDLQTQDQRRGGPSTITI